MPKFENRSKTALLIVDVQKGVVKDAHQRDAVVANIGRLVQRARQGQVPVVWIRHSDEQLAKGSDDWLRFWQVGEFVPEPVPGDYPDWATLREAWTEHQEQYEAFLRGLTQTDLDAPRILDATVYTLGELVQHSLNHSTYHRGQVALLIRPLGHKPPFTDYHDFLAQARPQAV